MNTDKPADRLTPAEESRVSAAISLSKEPPKKDAAAARELPALYESLARAREAIEKLKALPLDHINVHSVAFNAGGDEFGHKPLDKDAWRELLMRDLDAGAQAIAEKIKALGFDPG